MADITLRKIVKRYEKNQTIHGVDLQINSGEFVVFVGPSGCGKSTLLRMVAGLEEISDGELYIDAGAEKAVHHKGSSLLPKGIQRVQGEFERGDVVRIMTPAGRELARGISRYNSVDLTRIAGKHSDEIEACLGYGYGPVAIHRDDLVLL